VGSIKKKKRKKAATMPSLAVITGAAQGIGAGIAEVLAANGVTVAIVDIQRDKLIDVRARIIEAGGEAAIHVANVTDINSVKSLANEIVLDHGVPDVLVNNAGVLYFQDFLEGDTDSWINMMNTNIMGYLHTMSVFIPMMKEAGKGHIVNIGSSNSREPAAGMAVYSGTKAFWLGTTPALRKELRGTGIKITQVEPGAVRTEGVMKVMEDPRFKELHDKFYPRSLLDVEKAINQERMVAKDIGEVVWDTIKSGDRIYEKEVHVGNME